MAYTENKSIDGLTAITPTTDDLVVTMDQAEVGVAKTSTLLSIYNLFKTTYDTVYAKYLGDADFYKYSIVTSVASGNLTVALKNYEGNDPTASKPVKIQIGGVIRTITSALTVTMNSGTNWFNAGSTELATKEIDYFPYLIWYTTNTSGPIVTIGVSRVPSANVAGDLVIGNATNEKGFSATLDGVHNVASTDFMTNIGRFNATLSAGGAYTWSIPATSVIINRPCYESNWREINPQLAWTAGTAPTSVGIAKYFYKIIGNMVVVNYFAANYSGPGINVTRLEVTLPFSLSAGIGFSSMNTSLNVGGTPNSTTGYIGTASVANVDIQCNSVGADRWSIDGTYFI